MRSRVSSRRDRDGRVIQLLPRGRLGPTSSGSSAFRLHRTPAAEQSGERVVFDRRQDRRACTFEWAHVRHTSESANGRDRGAGSSISRAAVLHAIPRESQVRGYAGPLPGPRELAGVRGDEQAASRSTREGLPEGLGASRLVVEARPKCHAPAAILAASCLLVHGSGGIEGPVGRRP